jgi:hypothetical protein
MQIKLTDGSVHEVDEKDSGKFFLDHPGEIVYDPIYADTDAPARRRRNIEREKAYNAKLDQILGLGDPQ